MDILILTFKYHEGKNLAESMKKHGHEVQVEGITLAKGSPLHKVVRLIRTVYREQGKHDVVIVENPFWDALAGILLVKMSRGKSKMIFYSKGFTPAIIRESMPRLFQGIGFQLLKSCIKEAVHVVYISRWLQKMYLRESGIPGIEKKPSSVIHHAPDSFFLEVPEFIRPVDPLDKPDIRICYAGRFAPKEKAQGALLLLDALATIRLKYPELLWQAYFAGGGSYLHLLQTKNDELGLSDRVKFPGKLSREELRELYHSSDIFFYSSFQDSITTVVMEAQACGLPAIVTTGSGVVELVENNVTGLVCEPDPEAIADAVTSLIFDPSKRHEMGVKAKIHIRNNFSWDICASKFNEVLSGFSPTHSRYN